MPPHCDSLDGPVVQAAIRALDAGDVDLVLPYVTADGEPEIREAFTETMAARAVPEAKELAERYFFETVVRVHRRGEGAPYTGLKPAGLDVGPVIPLAERAIETGSPDELFALLSDELRHELKHRFDEVMALQRHADGPLAEARAYVGSMLGLQVWSHAVHLAIHAPAHAEVGEHEH